MGMVDGKVALITGASSGQGRAGSHQFAQEGAAHVYVADLSVAGGEETVELVEQAGGSATFVHVDVTDEDAFVVVACLVVAGVGGGHQAAATRSAMNSRLAWRLHARQSRDPLGRT